LRISDLIGRGRTLSIELWPPRNEAAEQRLERALERLRPLSPSFTSITYGAGGSTRERTHDLVIRLNREGWTVPLAHLTCAAHRRSELEQIVTRYRDAGIDNLLALRGDPPLDSGGVLPEGDLRHALELVQLGKEVGPFCVAVAAHPEGHPDAPSMEVDRRYLAEKLRLADFAITQFFFRVEDYLSLVDWLRSAGVDRPVLPGVMPITRLRTVARMAELSGCAVPRPIVERIESAADRPDEVRRIGVEVASELCEKLLAQGVPGLHFYTMNEADATWEVCRNIGFGFGVGAGEDPPARRIV
jgi:methylenetetrahydrofolate reductase (NADPH)